MYRSRPILVSLSFTLAIALLVNIGCGSDDAPKATRRDPIPRKVLLEIDRMAGTPELQLEQTINGQAVSLKSIYAEAGIDIEVRQDQVDLPRQDSVSLADLHAMMSAFRSVSAPDDVMRLHALVLTRESGDPDTLGVMFDFDADDKDGRPREGFAIFADPHVGLAGGQSAELLLTVAHELAHCFNLHHPDWEGQQFRRGATVESYSLADSVRWTLSSHSKAHIKSDPGREVWPGRANIGFGQVTEAHLKRHNPSPSESFRVVDPERFTARRPMAAGTEKFTAAFKRDASGLLPPDRHPVKLQLEAPKQSYVVGEPVILTVGLHNTGTTPQSVYPLLDPKYRFLNVDVRRPGGEFDAFEPVMVADARGVQPQALAPGGSIHGEAKIFYGTDGWVFEKPGQYVIRADYAAPLQDGRTGDPSERLSSTELEITVTEPATAPGKRARELILGHQQGLFLVLGGGDHLKRAAEQLKRVVREAPGAPQTAAVRLALGKAALNPTIDPSTGVQSAPRIDEAKGHLAVALKANLSALSMAKAQVDLVDALEGKGRTKEAARVRGDTLRQMQKQESVKEYINEIKLPLKPSPPRRGNPDARRQ